MNMEEIIRVQIIQPLIPAYRVSLYKRLSEHSGLQIKVCASKIVPGINNLCSVDTGEKYADLEHPCLGFLGNRFLWQLNLILDPDMKQGDVLVVSGNLKFFSNIPLIIKAKRKKIGVVWWGHGFSKRRNWYKDIINRKIMDFIDVRLLYTDQEVEEYKKIGFPANKLFATNNAIDIEPIRKATSILCVDKLKAFQERENIQGKKILLFCGRRTKLVSMEHVFAALSQLRKTDDKFLFVIIGPDDSNGVLGRKAKEIGVDDCIRWVGTLIESDAAPWFLSARCFVFPGAIGLSILHAFSYGLPVIVPDCVHNPEIAALSVGKNGLIYKSGNIGDLTEKITAITDNSEYHQNLSAFALKTVLEDYNMDNMANRYVAAIRAASQ